MFTVAFCVWLVVLFLGIALSAWHSEPSSRVRRFVAPMYWASVAAACLVGVAPLATPGVDLDRESNGFSVDRALAHIERLAQRPHPMGSAANQDARDYIAEELRDLGLEPEIQTSVAPDYYGSSGDVAVVNVMARISGTAPTGAVMVVAHVDSHPETPGANDNASGVAVTLETAQDLLAGGPLRNDVILLFTDGEEPAPRYGSTAFVDDHRWFDDVRFVVNLEAIGNGGPSTLLETNGPQRWILDRFVESAAQPVAFSFLTEATALIGGSNTDFAPFRDAGVPGVEFVYFRGSSIYHTAADTPDSVSRRTLHSHGVNTLGLVRRLAAEDLVTSGDGDDMVFFTVGRFQVVRYPTSWGIPIVLAAGVLILAAVRRRRVWSVAASEATRTLLLALLAGIVAAVLWTPFAGWRDTMGVLESYVGLFVLAAVTAGLLIVPFKFEGRLRGSRSPEGVLLVWWSLALVTALIAPGMSYLFGLPALVGATALGSRFGDSTGWRSPAPALLTVGIAAVVLIPAIDTFFQFAQPRPGNTDSEILPTVALPVLLIALLIQLTVAFRPRMEHAVIGEATGEFDLPASTGEAARTPDDQASMERSPLSPGRAPWDPVNGMRIGAFTGGLFGAALIALSGVASFWIIACCGVIGGGAGYWSEKRKQRSSPNGSDRARGTYSRSNE